MDISLFESKMKNLVDTLRTELQLLRGNRPSPKMVEDIKVEHYGQAMTVRQLGSISIMPPREIVIQVWDMQAVSAVAKAIETSNLKVVANVSGNTIRVNLPQLTDERKKELEKVVRKGVEDTRIRIRGLRDEINKEVKKAEDEKKLSEDAAFNKKELIQKSVDKMNQEIEKLLEAKIKELVD